MSTTSMIEMNVFDEGENILHYQFGTILEASEMLVFLKDFLPEASFVIRPLRH